MKGRWMSRFCAVAAANFGLAGRGEVALSGLVIRCCAFRASSRGLGPQVGETSARRARRVPAPCRARPLRWKATLAGGPGAGGRRVARLRQAPPRRPASRLGMLRPELHTRCLEHRPRAQWSSFTWLEVQHRRRATGKSRRLIFRDVFPATGEVDGESPR